MSRSSTDTWLAEFSCQFFFLFLKSERVTASRSIVNDSLSLRDNSHPIKAFLLLLFEGWRGVESERGLVFKRFQSCFFTILVSFPQTGACIKGEKVPALIKIYGDTVSIQRWNMAPLNIQDLSLNDSIPHHPSNRKKRKASIVYRVYTIDKSLSLKLRGDLLYHQMKRN